MKIRDMRKALDSKEISAKELAQTYFERIKKYDDKVKSFITVTAVSYTHLTLPTKA